MPEEKPMWYHKTIGDRGEEIVAEYLRSRGVTLHENDQRNSHVVDFFCEGPKKPRFFFVEVKTKKSFKNSMDECGFETKYWKNYLQLEEDSSLQVWIIFVDVRLKRVYGKEIYKMKNDIRHTSLEDRSTWNERDPYKKKYNDAVMFPVDEMRHLMYLTDKQVEYIKYGSNHSRGPGSETAATV